MNLITNALPFYFTISTLTFFTAVKPSLALKATDCVVAIGIRLALQRRDNGPLWCLSTTMDEHGISVASLIAGEVEAASWARVLVPFVACMHVGAEISAAASGAGWRAWVSMISTAGHARGQCQPRPPDSAAKYRIGRGRIAYVHTEIYESYEGMGLSSRLARAVVDDARVRGLMVVPFCPFIVGYIDRHLDEYRDLAAPEMLAGDRP